MTGEGREDPLPCARRLRRTAAVAVGRVPGRSRAPGRPASFGEGTHPFPRLVALDVPERQFLQVVEPFARQRPGGPGQFPGRRHRLRCSPENLPDVPECHLGEPGRRCHVVHQSDLRGTPGVDAVAGQHQLPERGRLDAGRQRCRDDRGDGTDPDFREREGHGVGGEHDVAGGGQPETSAPCRTRQDREDGFRRRPDPFDEAGHGTAGVPGIPGVPGAPRRPAVRAHLTEVGAGAERGSGMGHHDHPDAVVSGCRREALRELLP